MTTIEKELEEHLECVANQIDVAKVLFRKAYTGNGEFTKYRNRFNDSANEFKDLCDEIRGKMNRTLKEGKK